MTPITRDMILRKFGWFGSDGIPWETIDDTLCKPDGCFRRWVEEMVRSGDLAVEDGRVRLASFPPLRSPANRRWVKRRDAIIDVLKFVGVSIEKRCHIAGRIMVALFGNCPAMKAD